MISNQNNIELVRTIELQNTAAHVQLEHFFLFRAYSAWTSDDKMHLTCPTHQYRGMKLHSVLECVCYTEYCCSRKAYIHIDWPTWLCGERLTYPPHGVVHVSNKVYSGVIRTLYPDTIFVHIIESCIIMLDPRQGIRYYPGQYRMILISDRYLFATDSMLNNGNRRYRVRAEQKGPWMMQLAVDRALPALSSQSRQCRRGWRRK